MVCTALPIGRIVDNIFIMNVHSASSRDYKQHNFIDFIIKRITYKNVRIVCLHSLILGNVHLLVKQLQILKQYNNWVLKS